MRTAPGTGGDQPAQPQLLDGELYGEPGRGGEGEIAGEGELVSSGAGDSEGVPGGGRASVGLVTS